MDNRTRALWIEMVGPDPDTDELYTLVCPECNEEIPHGEEKWYQRVAFCRNCLPGYVFRVQGDMPVEPSDALKRLRAKVKEIAEREEMRRV